jgi:hypothetical protein
LVRAAIGARIAEQHHDIEKFMLSGDASQACQAIYEMRPMAVYT